MSVVQVLPDEVTAILDVDDVESLGNVITMAQADIHRYTANEAGESALHSLYVIEQLYLAAAALMGLPDKLLFHTIDYEKDENHE